MKLFTVKFKEGKPMYIVAPSFAAIASAWDDSRIESISVSKQYFLLIDPAEENTGKYAKQKPEEISEELHRLNATKAIGDSVKVDRKEIEIKLSYLYNMGSGKIQGKAGILNYLVENGFLIRDKNMFSLPVDSVG